MVQTVAETLDLAFNRTQFTPDLMPSDITGTEIIEQELATGKHGFRFVREPVFAFIVRPVDVQRLHSFPTRRSSDLRLAAGARREPAPGAARIPHPPPRSEEQRLNSSHVSISYAVFCLKKKTHGANGRRDARSRVQPHSVHAGPDAVRHHGHRDHRAGTCDREARLQVRARARFRFHRTPRRRPTATLFPYTTLFRSPPGCWSAPRACSRRGANPSPAAEIGRATSELQSRFDLVCRLLLEKKNSWCKRSPRRSISRSTALSSRRT